MSMRAYYSWSKNIDKIHRECQGTSFTKLVCRMLWGTPVSQRLWSKGDQWWGKKRLYFPIGVPKLSDILPYNSFSFFFFCTLLIDWRNHLMNTENYQWLQWEKDQDVMYIPCIHYELCLTVNNSISLIHCPESSQWKQVLYLKNTDCYLTFVVNSELRLRDDNDCGSKTTNQQEIKFGTEKTLWSPVMPNESYLSPAENLWLSNIQK